MSMAQFLLTAEDVDLNNDSFEATFIMSYSVGAAKEFDSISSKYTLFNATLMVLAKTKLQTFCDSYVTAIYVCFSNISSDKGNTHSNFIVNCEELKLRNRVMTIDGKWHIVAENLYKSSNFPFKLTVKRVSQFPTTTKLERQVETEETKPNPWFVTMYDDDALTDFKLCGRDGSVSVHRMALSAVSPVLRRMMEGSWSETEQKSLTIPDTPTATLQQFKRYIYLSELPEDVETLLNLKLLGSMYLMPALEDACARRLSLNVTYKTAFNVISFAVQHNMTDLLLAVLEQVQNKSIKVADIRQFEMETEKKENKEDIDELVKVLRGLNTK